MKQILRTLNAKKTLTASLILLLSLCGNKSFAQLSGIKTIPGTYATIADAITDLNTNGVIAPGVTFNIAAGYTESWDLNASPGINTIGNFASGSASAPVIFQKSGAGADPLITVSGTSGGDAGILIDAASYITINGIDITDAGTSDANWVEYGIAIINDGGFSGPIGSQNDVIKNCTITLSAADNNNSLYLSNDYTFDFFSTIGIFQAWATSDFSSTTSAFLTTGFQTTNSFNSYYNNTIVNAGVGIALYMQSIFSITNTYDTNDDIGTLGGNTITGSGLAEAQGIYENTQVSSHIQNNTINLSSSLPAENAINGIYVYNQNGNPPTGTVEIDHNTITVSSTGDLSLFGSGFNGIDLEDGGGEIYNVHNNTVHNCVADYRNFNGISNGITGINSSANPANIYNNTVTNCSSINTPGGLTVTGINSGEMGSVINIYDNQINTLSSSGGATIYGINMGGAPDGASLVYNNFISNLTTSGTNIHGINVSTGNPFSIYYNSIYLDQTTGVNAALESYGIYISNDISSPIVVTDNLVVNTSTPGSGSGGITATLLVTGGTGNFDGYDPSSDHNDYYAGVSGQKNLIFQGDQDSYQDLGSFSTASNTDISSASLDPGFTSQTDLHSTHMTDPGVIVFGTPLSFITTDIDGNNRGVTSTDMGADEFGTCVALGAVSKPSGTALRCSGSGTSVYTIPAVTNANSYAWTVTGGGNTISAAPASNSATVTWASSFAGQAAVSVVAKNLCHTSAASTLSVTVNPIPSEIISFPATLPNAGDYGAAVDPSGNVYVADFNNSVINKLTPGGMTTPFINGAIPFPVGIATDPSGNLFVTDQGDEFIDEITPGGAVSTLCNLFGSALAVEGIGIDATATNLYVTDWQALQIYQIDIATGNATLFAGTGTPGNDGDGASALLADIGTGSLGLEEVAVDKSNNVYFADPGNHRVRMIAGTTANGHVIGNIYNFAGDPSGSSGNSGDGGPATAALLNQPTGVRVDPNGNVFIADIGNFNVRMVSPNGNISTIVNTSATAGNTGDGGLAPAATLTAPYGLAVDASGNLYISDQGNTNVREVFAPLPPAIAPTPTSVCPGNGTTVLTASSKGASSYAWAISPIGAGTISGTGTKATVTWNTTFSGTATVSVASSNGCGSTPSSSVDIISSYPIGGTALPIFSIICSGATKVLTASGAAGVNLQWQISSDNVNWSDITGANTTTYTTASADGNSNKFYRLLSKSSVCGDVASTTAEVDVSNSTISVTASSITDNSLILNWGPTGTGNYTISYAGPTFGTLTSVTPPKTLAGLTANGNYSVTVTQTGVGCVASGTLPGINTLCAVPTGVTVSSPANGQILVNWTGVPLANYRIYYRPLFAYNNYFTKDVSNVSSALITKQGNNNIYASTTYEVYISRIDCPSSGIAGQPTSPVNVTTLPAVGCTSPFPIIDSVRSVCPIQIEIFLHPGSSPTGTYNVYMQRITPSVLAVNSYGVNGNYFTINTPYSGDVYLIAAEAKCAGGALSALYVYPGNLTIKPSCTLPNNLVLSNPTCHGFTATWNADQCITNLTSEYAIFIRRIGTLNYNSYGVPLPPGGLSPIKTVSFLFSGSIYQVGVRAIYNCSGSVSYGPPSLIQMITTLSSGCRDEEPDQPEESEPSAQQYSADNHEVFSMYPNPNSGTFTVSLSRLNTEADAVRIEVINMMGQTVVTQLTTIEDGFMSEFINVPNGTASGTYIVRLTAGKNVYTAMMNISR